MNWSDWKLRLRAFRNPRRAECELDEELAFHLEMEARKRSGEARPEAAARRAFGGLTRIQEQCREIRGLTAIDNLARDIRYGLRMLRKSPVFTAVAVLSLAIGIGATTAVFTLVDAVLLRMLPVRHPEQLVVLHWGAAKSLDISRSYSSGWDDGHGFGTNVFSWRIFAEMRGKARALNSIVGFSPLGRISVAVNGQALVTGGMLVSGNYFADLGAATLLGRPITGDDETAGGLPVAVLSYRLWERAFGLDPAALGRTITVNGRPCTVIGVTPKSYVGVSPGGLAATPEIDVTLPIRAKEKMEAAVREKQDYFGGDLFWIQAMGRRTSRPETAARAELAGIIAANLPEAARRELAPDSPDATIEPGSQGLSYLRDVYRKPLLVLMAVVGLTLLMACANLAALLLSRAAARRQEILMRMALGARRARVVRQLLIEGALLAAAGSVAGLAFAWWGVRALLALEASGMNPIRLNIAPDARVLAFTAAAAVATTLLFALAPAMRATRVDLAGGLKEDTPGGGNRFGAARILLAVQIGAALLLATGAVLFTRTLANLHSVPLGFSAGRLIVFDIAPGRNGYDEARANQLYLRLLDRLRQTPGVVSASTAQERLMSGYMSNGSIRAEDGTRRAQFNFVGPDFCRTLQIPVVLGRDVELRDMAATPRVAVINETAAHRFFGDVSPVGKRFRWDFDQKWEVEVVGVARDARYDRLRRAPSATIYAPYTQAPWGWEQQLSFAVRTAGDPAQATAGIRRAVADLDQTLPLIDLRTMEAQIDGMLAEERLFASLVSLFAAVTLALACIGLYGIVASSVAARTREIGVRIALGAGRAAVLRMVLRQVVVTAAAGLALGLPAAWTLSRIVESQLYGVKPHDPATLAMASAAVLAVSAAAALLPARRATRIDPVRALRYD